MHVRTTQSVINDIDISKRIVFANVAYMVEKTNSRLRRIRDKMAEQKSYSIFWLLLFLLEKGLNVNSEKIRERIQELTTITAKYIFGLNGSVSIELSFCKEHVAIPARRVVDSMKHTRGSFSPLRLKRPPTFLSPSLSLSFFYKSVSPSITLTTEHANKH